MNSLKTLKLKSALPIDTLRIGVDMSVDSCGVTLIFGDLVVCYLFVPSMPPDNDTCPEINYIEYRKQYNQSNYSAKERSKMWTRRTLANKIEDSILSFIDYIYPNSPKYIQIAIEGAAFGYMNKNSNSLIELVCFRSVIEDRLYHMWPLGKHISFDTIAPKSLKKEATGNGSADKLLMIETGISKLQHITWCGKIDDAMDALHLALSNQLSEPEPRLW